MSLQELQSYTYTTKYARWDETKGRRETFEESADRVFSMHERRYAGLGIDGEIAFAKAAMKDRLVLGSQRALQFGGKPIETKNARLFNCSVSYADRPRFFQESLWMLLCGCGVGFSVQKHHTDNLPYIAAPRGPKVVYTIPDSIEGWADALGVLLSSYFTDGQPFPVYGGKLVEFDYSLIRPRGSVIASGSGKAPGPEPLKRSLDKIRETIDERLAEIGGAGKLRSIDVYDVVMHASDAVLSGGVRRSATICLFSPDDQDMATAKTGDWFIKNPQRGRSNNSALLLRDSTTYADFAALMKSVKEFGEPGFVWADNTEVLLNPCCVTGDTWVSTDVGAVQVKDLVGTQFTALVNGATHMSSEAGFWATGVKPVSELKTTCGLKVEATADHRFLVRQGDGEHVWRTLDTIRPGMAMVLHDHWAGSIVRRDPKGWLLGYLLGNGTFDGDTALIDTWGDHREALRDHAISCVDAAGLSTYKTITGTDVGESGTPGAKTRFSSAGLGRLAIQYGIREKVIPSVVEAGDDAFVTSFLRGWFDADGSFQGDLAKGYSIRLSSSKLPNLEAAQRMLLRLGIRSVIYPDRTPAGSRKLPDGHGGLASYDCEAVHELVVSASQIVRYAEAISFEHPEKLEKLTAGLASYKRGPYKTRFTAVVESVRPVGEKQVYDCTIPGPSAFDANGFYAHNCEIAMYPRDDETEISGWSVCNLCEINMKLCDTYEKFERACRAAAILGTLQAGYTDFAYLGPISEKIIRREALLGVSMTGMMDTPKIAFDPVAQREMANLIKEVNADMAARIGINVAARTTCVKPAGSTSCILGTASGIHPHHAGRYFRRVQANTTEAPLAWFQAHNPRAVEKSVWNPNGTDDSVIFCVTVSKDALVKNTLSAIQLLDYVRLTQDNWVSYGRRLEACVKPWLQHNVSNTITVRDDEWDGVTDYIYEHRSSFTGISLLPAGGDLDYPQAPFCAVPTYEEVIEEYGVGALFASGLIVDGLHAYRDNLWAACDCALDRGEDYTADVAKADWVRRAKKFAANYFGGDVRKMTYCLKRVHNCKLWEDLTREYQPVDYSLMLESTDETKLEETVACGGGACELK